MVTLYILTHKRTQTLKENLFEKGTYAWFLSAGKLNSLIYAHAHIHALPHLHNITYITFQLMHGAAFSDTEITLCTETPAQIHTHAVRKHTYCCDPRERASCVCAGAVTPALIINQWANCKRTQSASLAHMTSPMHVNIHRVYKPFKVSGPLQYSWLIITDGRRTRSNTLH